MHILRNRVLIPLFSPLSLVDTLGKLVISPMHLVPLPEWAIVVENVSSSKVLMVLPACIA